MVTVMLTELFVNILGISYMLATKKVSYFFKRGKKA